MRIYHLLKCNDSTVVLPMGLQAMGFEPESVHHMYFLDHAREQETANVLELILLPFKWRDLDRLYTVTIKLKNIPHATAHAVQLLTDNGIDIKTCSATDSIAGNIGSIETVICSPHNLETLDQLFSDAVQKNRNDVADFIDPTGYQHSDTLPNQQFIGRFLTGRKYIANFAQFQSKLVPSVAGDPIPLKTAADGRLVIDIPGELVEYLARSYKTHHRSLAAYHAALTVDTEFSSLSISFLDPEEILVHISLILKDKTGLFFRLSDYFGRKQVNFRLVYLKNIRIGTKVKLDLICDISRTEYPLFTIQMMRRVLAAALRAELDNDESGTVEPGDILRLDITAVHGYPKQLPHFGDKDLFEVVDLLYFRITDKVVQLQHKLSTYFEGATDDKSEQAVMRVAEVMRDGATDADLALSDVFRALGPVGTSVQIDRPTVAMDGAAINVVHGSRHYWFLLRDHDGFCLVMDNAPPKTLFGRYYTALLRLRERVLHERQFNSLCKDLFSGLSYDFPTQKEFDAFGELPAEVFSKTAAQRFSRLGGDYIKEKYEVDKFPIVGNELLARCLRHYLVELWPARQSGPGRRLRLIDIGPGVGALSTLFAVQELGRAKLLLRTDLTLVDVAQEVLDACRSGDFVIPGSMEEEYLTGLNVEDYKTILRGAQTVQADISSLSSLTGPWDIVLSGFTHHHMNNEGRRRATEEMCRIAAPGAFVAVVDESMTYVQYLEYLMNHVRDSVDAAQESFLQDVSEHALMFETNGVRIRFKKNEDRFYYFWGVKELESRQKGSTQLLARRVPTDEILKELKDVEIRLSQRVDYVGSMVDSLTRVVGDLPAQLLHSLSENERQEMSLLVARIKGGEDLRRHLEPITQGFALLTSDLREQNDNLEKLLTHLLRRISEKELVDSKVKITLSALFFAIETKVDLGQLGKLLVESLDEASFKTYEAILNAYHSFKSKRSPRDSVDTS